MTESLLSPTITVVIATRDRPDALRLCVGSILNNRHDSFEVVVVDQSKRPCDLGRDRRLRHVVTGSRGKSAALNEGLDLARGSLVAFTDDDCTVPVDWLERAEQVLVRHPEVALAFGNLRAIAHDRSAIFVPETSLGTFQVITGCRSVYIRGGAGANMIARRSLFEQIGGYDELIGPGARFRACEEFDIYYRALAAGSAVARVPTLEVAHWGARPYGDGSGRQLLRDYSFGEGAVVAKHLRLRDLRMIRPGFRIMMDGLNRLVRSLGHLSLTGVGTFGYKWLGLLEGLVTPVDGTHRVYRTSPLNDRR